jgi:hypothetical protein
MFERQYRVEYICPRCKHEWNEVWSCACDSSCPECDLSDIEATQWTPLPIDWTEDAPYVKGATWDVFEYVVFVKGTTDAPKIAIQRCDEPCAEDDGTDMEFNDEDAITLVCLLAQGGDKHAIDALRQVYNYCMEDQR